MFPITELNNELLDKELSLASLFDFYRLVDVDSYNVVEYAEGSAAVDTHKTCYDVWGAGAPCPNCTSRACVRRKEPIVKLMTLDDKQFLLIYSVPVTVEGKTFALELIKDVSSSLMVPNNEISDNLEIIDMIRQFNHVAVRDSFTHLYNKSYALNKLQDIIDTQTKAGEFKLELVMLDLDLFKNINDNYGHMVGDDILLLFAKELGVLAVKFEGGWAVRYGGDEFLLIAPNGFQSHGEEMVLSSISSFTADVAKNVHDVSGIGVSYGRALLRAGDTPRSLIDRADTEMYKMKEIHHARLAVASA